MLPPVQLGVTPQVPPSGAGLVPMGPHNAGTRLVLDPNQVWAIAKTNRVNFGRIPARLQSGNLHLRHVLAAPLLLLAQHVVMEVVIVVRQMQVVQAIVRHNLFIHSHITITKLTIILSLATFQEDVGP